MTPTYDFFSPESQANPYPLYHRLRTEYPIHFNEPLGAHVLMRYADISAALRNPRLSSRRVSVFFSRIPEQCHRAMESFGQSLSLWLLFQDAPDHSRLRSLVNQAFTLKSVEEMRPRIERIVGELLDAAQARGRMDAIRDLAYPLPTTVNRDPAQFPDPDRLDLGRTPNRHLAFGFGTHFCLGGPLARAEGQIAFRTLLERFPRLRLATDQVEWRESVSLRGLKTLPLMWD
jgi:Cytochrome P450